MKQHITAKQANEMNEKGRKELLVWLKKDDRYGYPDNCLMAPSIHNVSEITIGKMIEFLGDSYNQHISPLAWRGDVELCDSLWEAVKEVLEK